MRDRLIGRKSRDNWGEKSKRELKYTERLAYIREAREELAQDIDEQEDLKVEEEYQKWIANHWVNNL